MKLRKKNVLFAMMTLLVSACSDNPNPSSIVDPNSSNNPPTGDTSMPTPPSSNEEPSSPLPTPPSSSGENEPSIPNNEMETNEILSSLRSSPFSALMSEKENLGLSEVKSVGIDQDKFENEVLYHVPLEGTFYNAEDIGVTSDAANNSGTLSIFLKNIANVEGNKIIRFKDNTTYPFSAPVDALGINDLYFVGGENTIFLYSGWGTYFEARMCKNIQIHNITFDMKYSPTIGGPIKRFEEKESSTVVVLDISDEFDLTQDIYKNWNSGLCGSYMECYYDELAQAYVPNPGANLVYNSPTSSNLRGILDVAYDDSNRELSITINRNFPYCAYRTPVIGTHVSLAYTMYENHGFYFQDCQEAVMEHVTVHVTGGMGLRVDRGKNIYLNHVQFTPKKGSARIMTCTADIIHTIGLEGKLMITNCRLGASHDDALNIKSFYLRVDSVNASTREIVANQTQSECTINNYTVGDVIEVYNPANMERVDTFTIVDVVKKGTGYTFTVDKRPRNVVAGYNIGNDTKSTRMTLHNTLIENKRNRGILLQTRYSEITNCTFRNVVMGAIQVLSVTDAFREAIVPKEILIANNKFINNQGTDISVFAYGNGPSSCVANTIRDVEITNNYFFNGTGNAVNLLANGNTKVHHNLFHYTRYTSSLAINVTTSSDVTIEDNVLYQNCNVNFVAFNNCANYVEKNNEMKGA